MIKQFINKYILFPALLIIVCGEAHANFTISPIRLKIQKDEKIGALTLQNNSNEVVSFQLTGYKVESAIGGDVDKETKDLLITPLSFRLAPGKAQLIRVAIKNSMTEVRENAYRISVRELPHKIKKSGAHVQTVTEFRIPISITHTKDNPEPE